MEKLTIVVRIALCLLAMMTTACSTTDEHDSEAAPIVFSGVGVTDTRASSDYISSSSFVYHSRIGVFCYYTGSSPWSTSSASALPNFMYDQAVERQYEGAWTYQPVKYWPNQTDDKLTFYGYYPHDGVGITLKGSNATAGLPAFTFNVQERSQDQVDFMLSDVDADEMHISSVPSQTSVSYQVALRFHHALSRIVLRVVDEATNGQLDFTATLSGWYDQGDCQTGGSGSIGWSSCSENGTVFTTDGAVNANQRILLMIPGNLRGEGLDPVLKFRYIYQGVPLESAEFHLNRTGASTPGDTSDDLTEWEPGKTYTYTYHVSITGNFLSVAVNPWYQAGMVFEN